MGRYTSGGIGRDIIAGAVAGAAAVWLVEKMNLRTTHAAVTADQPTGVDPAHAAANTLAAQAGADIGPAHDNALGHGLHYAAGAGLGALYGLLRGMAPGVATGRGSVYGLVTYLLGDEIGMPLLGLSRGPLEYSARDHARGALGHTLFGVFTDLGVRLISPWKDEVVILHGPTLRERAASGRQAIADGRDALVERGRRYVEDGRDYARQAQSYAADTAEAARARIDELDLPGQAKRGRKRARKLMERVGDYLPDAADVADLVDRGRRYVGDVAEAARARVPDRDDVADAVETGRKRARRFADDVGSRVPDRDDVKDAADAGRRRARKHADRLRDQLPDADDLADRGRKRMGELAQRAREQAEDLGGKPVKRFLSWLTN